MTKKQIAMTMALVMGASLMAGCGSVTGSHSESSTSVVSEQSAQSDENVVYGEVSSVAGDSISIKVGTKKEMTSKLELTGEEKTIAITSDTSIEKAGMGGPSGKPGDGESGQQNQPPSMPDGEPGQQNQPPSKPDGQAPDGSSSDDQSGEPPAMPGNGQPPQMQTEEIAVSEIEEGDTVEVTLDESGNAVKITVMSMGGGFSENGGPGGPGGGGAQSAPKTYEAVNTYSEDKEVAGETISSTGTDENAVHVTDGAKVTISDSSISRISSDSEGGDSSSFYGTGAAVLTTNGSTVIKGTKIDTDANGGAGVFSYGDGTSYVSDATISTKKGTSGGIHVAGGGTLYAWNTTAETQGQSSAAIRSDRGGGTMVVDGGSYTSNGTGSPSIYSTADIAVNKAKLTANASEAVCIEGNNSIHLFDCDLTGNMGDDAQNDTTWNVILYQSMSGDSEEGNSTFEMDGGTLTAKNGGMFYTTNTESTFTLKNVDITNAKDAEFFLRCTGNQNQRGWGSTGENGADCLFTAIEQKMEGDIQWDSISELDFYMTKGSTLSGAVINDESNAGNGGTGYCNLIIDKDSTWTVTGDSTLTKLENAGTIVDADGKAVTIKGTDGSVYVKGNSKYTVTVTEYKDSADGSGASAISSWSDYQVEKPA